jgi:hypothetical protein
MQAGRHAGSQPASLHVLLRLWLQFNKHRFMVLPTPWQGVFAC